MNDSKGVWAHIARDHSEYIECVYATEIEALREAVSKGYGRVAFVEFGDSSGWRK